MIFSDIPIRVVDLLGSMLMIVFSVLCFRLVSRLKRSDSANVIWTYLFWVCCGLMIFAVSRSAGHILKQILLMSDQGAVWNAIRPFSGAVNTFTFMLVASITLFFQRSWHIYQQILKDRQALHDAHRKLMYLNQNLEKEVEERTRALALTEKQVAHAEKLASIGQLSAGVAHEINNPLGIILGYTQLLIRNEPPDTERRGDLKTIEKHVRNCKAVVENLLSFARSAASKMAYANLHDLMDDVIGFVGRQFERDAIRIEKEYDPDMPALLADEKKIKQVLVNLLMNAGHAIGTDGVIRLSTRIDAAAGKAVIRVEDTGCGIPPENISRVFDPFFTTKPTGKGTGLGLSVSYGIVKDHGGDISAESAPGEGTAFTVTLPAAPENAKVTP